MADKKSEKKRRAEEDARRRDRDDWFARQLGDEWVAVEPGIYRQAMWRPLSDAEPELTEPEALDETLLDAIPAEEEPPASPDERRETGEEKTSSRGWWRSR